MSSRYKSFNSTEESEKSFEALRNIFFSFIFLSPLKRKKIIIVVKLKTDCLFILFIEVLR